MNVNPFSYLIEKLKGKVDKSGDTMSGNLSVQVSGNAYLKVTNTDKSVDATLNSASNGQHGLYSNGYNDGTFHDSGKWLINRQADGSTMINGNVEVPSQTGTLALKSDIFPTSLIGSPWGVTRRITFSGKAQEGRASALLIPCGSVGIGGIIPITFRTDLNGDITKVYVASNTDGVIVDPDYDNAIRIPPVYNGWADYTIIKLYNDEAYTWTVSDV